MAPELLVAAIKAAQQTMIEIRIAAVKSNPCATHDSSIP
jgi:hypothetical protein